MIQLHGGTMELASNPGKGTTVTIRIPPERVLALSPQNQAPLKRKQEIRP